VVVLRDRGGGNPAQRRDLDTQKTGDSSSAPEMALAVARDVERKVRSAARVTFVARE
jgi:hypothetical protein